MKYSKFYIADKDGNSNCIIRSFCKFYNKTYDNVFKELISIKNELNADSYNDIIVFETYMQRHNTNKIAYGKNIKIEDLKLDDNPYIIFCYDKKDFYHMVTIINNTLYDKTSDSLKLYTINVYK